MLESNTFRLNYTARFSEAHKFLVVTEAQADTLLRKDLRKFWSCIPDMAKTSLSSARLPATVVPAS
ncbi:hypothetical protein AAK873_07085 [Heminiphilus faecis]|uniref:Uncharacterized protein n=1 Tax=Heminiphilus faecis TaxID=2601703 RepID=A0ABV4CVH5_9BACT|nr:hypothetical protein [Heminiphilus faecis]